MEERKSKGRRILKIKTQQVKYQNTFNTIPSIQPKGCKSDHRHPCGQHEGKHNQLLYQFFFKEIKTITLHNTLLKGHTLWKTGMKNKFYS